MPRSASKDSGREDSPPATNARQDARSPATGAMTPFAGSASSGVSAMRTIGIFVFSSSGVQAAEARRPRNSARRSAADRGHAEAPIGKAWDGAERRLESASRSRSADRGPETRETMSTRSCARGGPVEVARARARAAFWPGATVEAKPPARDAGLFRDCGRCNTYTGARGRNDLESGVARGAAQRKNSKKRRIRWMGPREE